MLHSERKHVVIFQKTTTYQPLFVILSSYSNTSIWFFISIDIPETLIVKVSEIQCHPSSSFYMKPDQVFERLYQTWIRPRSLKRDSKEPPFGKTPPVRKSNQHLLPLSVNSGKWIRNLEQPLLLAPSWLSSCFIKVDLASRFLVLHLPKESFPTVLLISQDSNPIPIPSHYLISCTIQPGRLGSPEPIELSPASGPVVPPCRQLHLRHKMSFLPFSDVFRLVLQIIE